MICACWAAQRCALLCHDIEDDRCENTGCKEIEPPSGFNRGKAGAFGQCDVNCDEKDVGHGEFTEDC